MRKPMPVRVFAAALFSAFLLAACQTPEQALLDSGQSQVKLRSIQTRSFDTTDKEKTLRTVIATMQDLNFVIDKADLTLGTVTATKLDRYMLRMTVSVRPRGQTQLLVRANANFGLKPVTEPEPYQKFFTSLGKAMFLTANEEGAGDEKEQAVEKTAPAAGGDQQAGLAAPPAVSIDFARDRPQIVKAIREYYDGVVSKPGKVAQHTDPQLRHDGQGKDPADGHLHHAGPQLRHRQGGPDVGNRHRNQTRSLHVAHDGERAAARADTVARPRECEFRT